MKKLLLFFSLTLACLSFGSEQKRVYVDIVGDLFHAGHVEFLRKAKAEGNYLIVGVLSDETVATYKRTPVWSLDERVRAIKACKYVDEVIPNCPLRTTEEYIKKHNIHLVVHGDDFNKEQSEDHYAVPIRLGIFKLVPYTKGISTTNIIERIQSRNDLAKLESKIAK